MKLPISWLNEYVSVDGISPQDLADKLLNIGFEVEDIIYLGKDIERVVAGKILDIKKHADADKLQVCMIDVGDEITTIVTGAQNIKTGDYVPVALDGATLPNGKKISAAPLRGVMSYGMMCSGRELGVDNDVIDGAEVDGILILPETAPGTDIKKVLRLDETVLDISVTANRSDCQSVYGMAREVAAVLGKKLKPLNIKYKTVSTELSPTVRVTDSACSRYTCCVIDNVKVRQSPQWMRDRLRYAGIRPINNIVDITNYVLVEVGQPLHAFDTKFVKDLTVVVRKAAAGEKITALDGNEYTLDTNMTVIADSSKPIAIAGVMGGEHSGINDDTVSVLLEAARFSKESVRTTSRTLGLRSDSSARYEKGVDYSSVSLGRKRALALFSMLKAGTVTDKCVKTECASATKTIVTTAKKISDLLGIEIPASAITKILKSLHFNVTAHGKELSVQVPLFREDVDNYTDLAEEVIRFYGYDNIKSTFMPSAKVTAGGTDTREKNISALKNMLCGFGGHEICTYSFIGKKAVDKLNLPQDSVLRRQIEIRNPLGEEYSVMRTQLISNMLGVTAFNHSKKNKNFRLFEVGKTYIAEKLPLEKLPCEHDVLCLGSCGENESFYGMKEAVTTIIRRFGITPDKEVYSTQPYLHPGVSCDLYLSGNRFCSFGKLHPSVAKNYDLTDNVFVCEMDLDSFISKEVPITEFVRLPKYQAAERDLAVIVKEEVPAGDILKTVKSSEALCSNVELFDIYRGEQIEKGYKSVALSFTLSAADRTLNDEDITRAVKNILSSLESKFGARLR